MLTLILIDWYLSSHSLPEASLERNCLFCLLPFYVSLIPIPHCWVYSLSPSAKLALEVILRMKDK